MHVCFSLIMSTLFLAPPMHFTTSAPLPRYKSAPIQHTSLTQFTEHFKSQALHKQVITQASSPMAHYQEVDYYSEEVRSRPAGFLGCQGGVQQHVVKEKFEEVDRVSRTGSHGHRHHGHGHGSGHFLVRETRVEEDFNTRTGEFLERKENFLVRSD